MNKEQVATCHILSHSSHKLYACLRVPLGALGVEMQLGQAKVGDCNSGLDWAMSSLPDGCL